MSSLMETVFFRGLGLAGVLVLLGWFALAAATEGKNIVKLQPNTPQLPPAAWGFKLIYRSNKYRRWVGMKVKSLSKHPMGLKLTLFSIILNQKYLTDLS